MRSRPPEIRPVLDGITHNGQGHQWAAVDRVVNPPLFALDTAAPAGDKITTRPPTEAALFCRLFLAFIAIECAGLKLGPFGRHFPQDDAVFPAAYRSRNSQTAFGVSYVFVRIGHSFPLDAKLGGFIPPR